MIEEMNLTLTKVRWHRMSNNVVENPDDEDVLTQEQKDKIQEEKERQKQEDNQSRMIFNKEDNTWQLEEPRT